MTLRPIASMVYDEWEDAPIEIIDGIMDFLPQYKIYTTYGEANVHRLKEVTGYVEEDTKPKILSVFHPPSGKRSALIITGKNKRLRLYIGSKVFGISDLIGDYEFQDLACTIKPDIYTRIVVLNIRKKSLPLNFPVVLFIDFEREEVVEVDTNIPPFATEEYIVFFHVDTSFGPEEKLIRVGLSLDRRRTIPNLISVTKIKPQHMLPRFVLGEISHEPLDD